MNINNTYVAWSSRIAFRIYGGSACIILLRRDRDDPSEEKRFILSKTATIFWKLMEEKIRVRTLINKFAKQKGYRSVNPDIKKQALLYLERFISDGLAEIIESKRRK